MKEIRLTKEEKKIEEISQSLATRKKDLTMTIRVNSDDIRKIRRKAATYGDVKGEKACST